MFQCPKVKQQATQSFTSMQHLSHPDFCVTFYDTIFDVPADWDVAQPADNIFLQRSYLTAVENAIPKGMRFGYVLFYEKGMPAGVMVCQLKKFQAEQSINEGSTHQHGGLWHRFGHWVKAKVASWASFDLLTCGSSLLTGEHGFHLSNPEVKRSQVLQLVEEAVVFVQKEFAKRGTKPHGLFIKDLCTKEAVEILEAKKFYEFRFHPCMTLHIDPSWSTFNDYLAAMTSKYRVRAKRAFKFGIELERIELNEERIHLNKYRIYELYKKVANQASFNMVDLHENYLLELKKQLGDQFQLFGYYHEGELIGYYTTIKNGKELEAHFLGIDGEYNRKFQLYLNILYDMIRQGIEMKMDRVVFARTAMEIKSSVGAIPEDLYGYLKADNRIMNWLLPKVLEYLRPAADWVQRSPFK